MFLSNDKEQAGLKLTENLPTSASRVLGLKGYRPANTHVSNIWRKLWYVCAFIYYIYVEGESQKELSDTFIPILVPATSIFNSIIVGIFTRDFVLMWLSIWLTYLGFLVLFFGAEVYIVLNLGLGIFLLTMSLQNPQENVLVGFRISNPIWE